MFRFKISVQKLKYVSSQAISQPLRSLQISSQRRNPSATRRIVSKIEASFPVYSKDRVRNVYNILRYHPWDSAREQLGSLDYRWDSFTVTQVLKAHPPMEKAWLFFNWASRNRNVKHDHYTYTTMMDIFGEANRISSMMLLFDQMKENKVKIDVVTYTSLIHWTSNSGDIDGAVKLWEEMKGKRLSPTVVSYTAYIKILLRGERSNEAIDVFKEMIESGLSPNRFTYTILMEYLASSGKFDEAMAIFDEMQEAGEKPDKPACNILIETCCRAGEVKTMAKVLHYMKENFVVLRYPVYRKALETLEKAGESVALLREVNPHFCRDQFQGPYTGFEVENRLVSSLLKKASFIAVEFLLQDFTENNVALDGEVMTKLIEVNPLLGYEYSSKMGIKLQRAAFLSLLGSSIRANSSHDGIVEIVGKMVEQGESPGTHLSCLLIHRLGQNGDAEAAARVFDLLPRDEIGCGEYTALMGAFFWCGNADMGIEVFERMRKEMGGDGLAVGTHRVLMGGLEKCGIKREVMRYYRKMNREALDRSRHGRGASTAEMSFCDLLFAGDLIPIPK